MLICTSICFVIFAEIINTAIEKTVDLVTTQYNELAKVAKDIAAGAVIISVINSVIIGVIVFGDKIINVIRR